MDFSVPHLRSMAPWLPGETRALRDLLDMSGLEVKHLDESAGVVSLELLANRGDHRSIEGVLREAAAHLQPQGVAPLRELDVPLADDAGWQTSELIADVDRSIATAYDLCRVALPGDGEHAVDQSVSTLVALAGLPADLPLLEAVAVAVTVELGQPLAAYDADLVTGSVTVRLSRDGELVRLSGEAEPRSLPAGLPLVCDAEKVLSVAGVVTTEAARPTALTRNALIEAAAFDPAAVRRATQALRVTTLASLRFERGSDATATRRGIRRALQILTASGRAPAAVLEDRRVVGDPSPREIVCGPAGAERLLGVPTDEVEFLDRLRWFGYAPTADGTGVSVPPWRVWDVTEPADVYEDLAQSRDYNSTPGALPLDVAGILPSPSEEAQERVTAALVTHGFLEVIGDAFESDADARLTAGRRVPSAVATGELLRLQNSVDPRQGMLRRSTLTTALRIIGDNVRDGVRDGRIFEWGRVYSSSSSSSSSSAAAVDETSVVWAAVFSRRENRAALLRSVQQVVEHLAHASGTPLRLREAELGTDSVLHAHQSATIDVDGRSVGLVGTVAPGVSDGILPGLSICYCELDVDALVASMLASRSRPPAPVRASNAMRRQLSYWVEDRVTVASLLGALRSAAAERPERISFAVESTFTSADSRSVTVEVVLDRSEWPNRTVASQVVVEIGERAAREHGRVALRTAEPVRAVPTAVR